MGQALNDYPLVKPFKTLFNTLRDIPELYRVNVNNKSFRIAFYMIKDLHVVLYHVTKPLKAMPETIAPAPLRWVFTGV